MLDGIGQRHLEGVLETSSRVGTVLYLGYNKVQVSYSIAPFRYLSSKSVGTLGTLARVA